MIYLELFRGRPVDQSEDGPSKSVCNGPAFPAQHFGWGYGFPILDGIDLAEVDGEIYYDGYLYSGFAITATPEPGANVEPFDASKAKLPEDVRSRLRHPGRKEDTQ